MEDILRDMLYELKERRKEIRADGDDSNPIKLKITLGEEVLVEKVIDAINRGSRLTQDAYIRV